MNEPKSSIAACFLAILVATAACSSGDSNTSPAQTSGDSAPHSGSPPSSTDGGTGNGKPDATATPAPEPVATNVLVLIGFPAAEGPANHDGHFDLFDFESEIGFKNSGDNPVTISSAEVINTSGAAFQLKSDNCSGKTLAKEQVCIIWVKLDPPTPPGRSVPYTGQLVIRMAAQNAYQILELSASASVPVPTSSTPSSAATPSEATPKPPASSAAPNATRSLAE